jgi:hypothetical protein
MSGNSGDAEFDAFAAAGEVEVGQPEGKTDGIEETKDGVKPSPKRGPPKPAATAKAPAGDDDGDDDPGGDDDQGGDDEGGDEKPKKTAAEHQIERLKR